MKTISLISTLMTLSFAATPALALMPNVDLRDLVANSPANKVEAQAWMDRINQNPAAYGIPAGVIYSSSPMSAIDQTAVSTIEIQNQTAAGADVFLIIVNGKSVQLNKVSVDAQGTVVATNSVDLLKNPPFVQIDIFNRQLTLSEARTGFLKFEPASVGSLINNTLGDKTSGYRSLSTPFRNAYLSRSKSELSRKEPEYYGGRPFLRVIDNDQSEYGGFTPFGLHYQMSDVLQRGFISNGCFRLRDGDLYELATLVFLSKRSGVPLSVVAASINGNRHPFPRINSWYNMPETMTNEKGKTVLKTIEHGLYVFDKTMGRPETVLPPLQ